MVTIGIRELRKRTSELIRIVREDGLQIEITYRGKPVALLIPVEHAPAKLEDENEWARLDRLTAEIEARWPRGIFAVDAIAED
ncbi:MAG: hypothetical protein Fur0022_35540 [Anaerolineales bacterium]